METFVFAQCKCTLKAVEQLNVDYLIIEKHPLVSIAMNELQYHYDYEAVDRSIYWSIM